MKKQSGLTLIELLVIVAFIGMLISTLIVVLGTLRFKSKDIQKLHDTKRLSDISKLRTGLDLFMANAGGYPDANSWKEGKVISCGQNGLIQVPRDTTSGGSSYFYTSRGKSVSSTACGVTVWSDYSLQFRVEGESSLGAPGIYCLTPNKGIIAGICQ
jgi:hypothetical protein